MGHIIGKDIYQKLGNKIDNLTVRTPFNRAFHNILKELFTEEQADVVVRMPFQFSPLNRIADIIRYDTTSLQKILDDLCMKGLVTDFWINDVYHYMPSPFIVGFFEFTMMRTGQDMKSKEWAGLYNEYFADDTFYQANAGNGEKVSYARALAYEETIADSEFIEILDYEKATALVENENKFSISVCPCRHEAFHAGTKECNVPLEKCSSFGRGADYLIRHNFAREVSKTEMLENIAQSKELGLVLNADNVQKNLSYMCHCCGCCCKPLLGISKYGYPNTVVTSNYIPVINDSRCSGCGKCVKACPINAISNSADALPGSKKVHPMIDDKICLGCGVCAHECGKEAIKLKGRRKRVITPETSFERVILQCLERGTLQNQIFDNPQNISQKYLRGRVGGFLKLPVIKRALMSDMLRSTFLSTMKTGTKLQGKAWLLEI